jgi:hypothetical protein
MHLAEVVNGTVLPGFSSIVRNETTDALLPAFALSHLHEVNTADIISFSLKK